MRLIFDGDILVHRACCACSEPIDFGDQSTVLFDPDRVHDYIETAIGVVEMEASKTEPVTEIIFALSCSRDRNFRKKICPEYKANRGKVEPPPGLPESRDMLKEWGKVWRGTTIEADDYIGIALTSPGGEDLVAVSIDKDFKQIPGRHMHMFTPDIGIKTVSLEMADHWHLLQTLMGDSSDGYPGCPGIGPVKATKVLAENQDDPWAGVLQQFLERGLTEADALKQARLARILRRTEWNVKKMVPRLWKPSKEAKCTTK